MFLVGLWSLGVDYVEAFCPLELIWLNVFLALGWSIKFVGVILSLKLMSY